MVRRHQILGSSDFKERQLAYARGSKNFPKLKYLLELFGMKKTTEYKQVIKHVDTHYCTCDSPHKCNIHIHPSQKVQNALNVLMEAMAEFDDSTSANSYLYFKSEHKDGEFESITQQKTKK
jgi:hypothetical protein